MMDRDDEQTPREPDGGTEGTESPDESAAGPSPATWAGRQRSSPEDAGEHPQLPEDEADEGEPAEASEDGAPEAAREAPEEAQEPDADVDDEADESEDGDGPDTEERLSQDTVEADTLDLADREAAREAALAGLRARAAENKVKHGTGAVSYTHLTLPTILRV